METAGAAGMKSKYAGGEFFWSVTFFHCRVLTVCCKSEVLASSKTRRSRSEGPGAGRSFCANSGLAARRWKERRGWMKIRNSLGSCGEEEEIGNTEREAERNIC